MKKLFFSFILLAVCTFGMAQKVYFLYFQSEPRQPFYLKMGEKIYSSTEAGYLILANLHDSTYNFSIGFAGNKTPEQRYKVSINRVDHGYLIKEFAGKGWGLFDLQTMSVQMNNQDLSKTEVPVPDEKSVSVFTDILSKAADDPSLKYKAVVGIEEEKKGEKTAEKAVEAVKEPKVETAVQTQPDEKTVVQKPPVIEVPVKEEIGGTEKQNRKDEAVKPAVEIKTTANLTKDNTVLVDEKKPVPETRQADEKSVKTDPGVGDDKKEAEVNKSADIEYKQSTVTRKSESSTTEGFGLVFTDDRGNGNIDTIRLLIPEPKLLAVVMKEPVNNAPKEEVKEEKKPTEVPAVDTVKVVDPKPVMDTAREEKEMAVLPGKKLCAGTAGKEDFFKLRKQMASVATNEEMINEAKTYFKAKCFTTQQIKNLSSLFLDDEGKYQFFDLAYSNVTDPEQFNSLVAELKDPYYITRFKAMLR
jgi:hypothetical protein